MVRFLLLLLLLGLLIGCSSRQWYEGGQGWRQHECQQQVAPEDYEACQRQSQRSYNDYQQMRNDR
ncbi:hypothetical protein [Marinospirillum perlucidum]|uniref:hypothetical protein n=1 Tax=Marinospirillum perlucidum TaxID=1982602 RepID=UPI000DF18976|nr:hypothetical protein [Marinospirillum perlucidum]